MLKNKHLWLGLSLALATSNAGIIISNSSNLLTINNLKQNNKIESHKVITNTTYGSLSNGSILSGQDENGNYHLFDIKVIINNPKLEPYAKYIEIKKDEITYDSNKINKDIIDEFNKDIAIISYNKEQLTSTNDLQIFQKQNLSKISTTTYKSNQETNKKFTFLQFGAANTHILLSGTEGIVDNILNYNDLSETLGLSYIAESHAKNSRAICIDFAKQFISKSSLKNSKNINNKIYENILNSIIDNSNLASAINNFPIDNDSKDLSIRYLLDNNDNVISVGYWQYNSENLSTANNLVLNHSFRKDDAEFINYNSVITPLLKWSDYADSWDNFTFLYPTIFANSKDEITYNVMDNSITVKDNELNFNTKKIQNKDKQSPVWSTINQPPPGHKSQGLVIYIFMWYDENTIYQQLKSSSISRAFDKGSSFSVNISKWTISNIINKK